MGTENTLVEPAKRALRPLRNRARAWRLAVGVGSRPAEWADIERLCPSPEFGGPVVDDREMVATLERLLLENIVPFWFPDVIDEKHGGYRGREVRDNPDVTNRFLMRQCRTLWFFARLSRSRYGTPEFLDAARHGFELISGRFLDQEFGGYHWAVDAAGRPVADHPQTGEALLVKDLCGQSFALYAISEFALASGSPEAERSARELFGVINDKARDRLHGGFHELYSADWGAVPEGLVIGADRDYKTFRTQIHLIEALAPYLELTGDPEARASLTELVSLATTSMIFRPIGVGVQVLSRDWKPVMDDHRNVHTYGHDLELIALVHDAQRALGTRPDGAAPAPRQLFSNAVWWGLDRDQGGFFLSGPVGRKANLHRKILWVQAEALLTSIELYSLTSDPAFGCVAKRTLDWIVNHQADWVNGEWHTVVRSDGSTSNKRGDEWNSPYHSGRAVLRSLELLAK